MSCSNCGTSKNPKGCKNNGYCLTQRCNQKTTYDFLANINTEKNSKDPLLIEVSFKNGRKDFFQSKNVDFKMGQKVVVKTNNGFDLGMISLKGKLVSIQMKLYKKKILDFEILRKATEQDVESWLKYINQEDEVLFKARHIVKSLKLDMKISDVEYQADGKKITFYYTAKQRIDFRNLIKILAQQFKVRIQMFQIGARQESAKIGGIGDCGRELCCSTWLKDFRAVNITAARYQQLSLNPDKLTGQCGKLKCCLNYELDTYLIALKEFPDFKIKLKSQEGVWIFQKADIFSRKLFYSLENNLSNLIELDIKRVHDIIAKNKENKKVEMSSLAMKKKNKETNIQFEFHDKIDRFDNIKN